MIAHLIDPKEQKITTVRHEGGYEGILGYIDSDLMDAIRAYDNGDVIYVDDNGLYKTDQFFFMHKNYPNPIAGKGLLVGTGSEGDDEEPITKPKQLKEDVKWIGSLFLVQMLVKSNPDMQDYRPLFWK
jgi:hypothetical protein